MIDLHSKYTPMEKLPDWITFDQIINFLKEVQENTTSRDRVLARKLLDMRISTNQNITQIIGNRDWGNRFDVLSEDVSEIGSPRIYKVVDDLLYDINSVRDWTLDWNILENSYFGNSSMGQLEAIGQSILGKAIEMCPMETGALRASGKCLVYPGFVLVIFDCPYASYVHEDLRKKHKIGRAKFLELATQSVFPNKNVWVNVHSEGVWVGITQNYKVHYGHYDA